VAVHALQSHTQAEQRLKAARWVERKAIRYFEHVVPETVRVRREDVAACLEALRDDGADVGRGMGLRRHHKVALVNMRAVTPLQVCLALVKLDIDEAAGCCSGAPGACCAASACLASAWLAASTGSRLRASPSARLACRNWYASKLVSSRSASSGLPPGPAAAPEAASIGARAAAARAHTARSRVWLVGLRELAWWPPGPRRLLRGGRLSGARVQRPFCGPPT
jgi:hypothetical protein